MPLIYMITAITGWITRISSFFVTLFTIINSIIDGSYSGGTNWWTAFNVSAWLDVVPVFAFIFWFDSLPKRAKRMGVNTLEVAIRDLQIATYIVGEVWGWTFTLFSFVVNSVMTFVGVVTG